MSLDDLDDLDRLEAELQRDAATRQQRLAATQQAAHPASAKDASVRPCYPGVQEWVAAVFSPTFARRSTPTFTWCAQWWRHPGGTGPARGAVAVLGDAAAGPAAGHEQLAVRSLRPPATDPDRTSRAVRWLRPDPALRAGPGATGPPTGPDALVANTLDQLTPLPHDRHTCPPRHRCWRT